MTSVVVFDYGFGNVRSMVRALANLDLDVTLTSDHRQALEADGLVVAGGGGVRPGAASGVGGTCRGAVRTAGERKERNSSSAGSACAGLESPLRRADAPQGLV